MTNPRNDGLSAGLQNWFCTWRHSLLLTPNQLCTPTCNWTVRLNSSTLSKQASKQGDLLVLGNSCCHCSANRASSRCAERSSASDDGLPQHRHAKPKHGHTQDPYRACNACSCKQSIKGIQAASSPQGLGRGVCGQVTSVTQTGLFVRLRDCCVSLSNCCAPWQRLWS